MSKSIDSIYVNYPRIPSPIHPKPIAPFKSGVYFIWDADNVVYVGQSKKLQTRLQGHECMVDGDGVSWVELPDDELDFAEAFYIGICRPVRNFGKFKAVKRQIAEESAREEQTMIFLSDLPRYLKDNYRMEVSKSTINRWRTKGRSSVRLEIRYLCGKAAVSLRAWNEFRNATGM